MVIGFARIDPRRAEIRLIRGVGEFLRLEGDAVAHPVHMAMLADQRAVEKIAGIELHAWLSGQHLEHAARGWILESSSELGRGGEAGIEREIMIIAAAGD